MSQRFKMLQELEERLEDATKSAPSRAGGRSGLTGRWAAARTSINARGTALWTTIGAAGVIVVALVALAVSQLSTADASWAAVPTRATASSIATAVAKCYGTTLASKAFNRPVLAESRGATTATVYVIGNEVATCRYDSADSGVRTNLIEPLRKAPGADQLGTPYNTIDSSGRSRLPAWLRTRLAQRPLSHQTLVERIQYLQGDGYGFWTIGQAGSRVSAVRFRFSDGRTVSASVQHGWYFAWWPWKTDPVSVTLRTSQGTHSSPMKSRSVAGIVLYPVAACRLHRSGCVFVKTAPVKATTPRRYSVAAAVRDCINATFGNPGVAPTDAFAGKLTLTQTHGIFTAMLNVTRQHLYACLVGGDSQDLHAYYMDEIAAFGPVGVGPSPGRLSLPYTARAANGGGRRAGGHVRPQREHGQTSRVPWTIYGPYLVGRIGKGVNRVAFQFANGRRVRATLQHGWYFAWWNWNSRPISVRISTTRETRTASITGSAAAIIRPRCTPGARDCIFASR